MYVFDRIRDYSASIVFAVSAILTAVGGVHPASADSVRPARPVQPATPKAEASDPAATAEPDQKEKQPLLVGVRLQFSRTVGGAPVEAVADFMSTRLDEYDPAKLTIDTGSEKITIKDPPELIDYSAFFILETKRVLEKKTVMIKATYEGVERSAKLKVFPYDANKIKARPRTIRAGQRSRGAMLLTEIVPENAVVKLTAEPKGFVEVPAELKFKRGERRKGFRIRATNDVQTKTTVKLSASVEGQKPEPTTLEVTILPTKADDD